MKMHAFIGNFSSLSLISFFPRDMYYLVVVLLFALLLHVLRLLDFGGRAKRESGGGLASALLSVSNIVSILKVGLMGCLERVITTSSTSSE